MKKKLVTLLSLAFLWASLTAWYIVIFDEAILVLSYNHPSESITNSSEKLLKGQKITGSFQAKEDNLGILALRFKSFRRIPYEKEDTLIFRLKEQGQKNWYYENEYRSGLTYDVPFLPFGFPTIEDSKGKIYNFELESLQGNDTNAVVLSERSPVLMSKYQQERSVVLDDLGSVIKFGSNKFFNSFQTIDVAYSSFVFALPLLFYLSWISPIKKWFVDPVLMQIESGGRKVLGKHYESVIKYLSIVTFHWMIGALLITLLFDILFLQVLNDLLYISAIVLWFGLINFYQKDSRISFLTGMGILLIAPIALQFNNAGTAEKAGAWAFMFLVAGTFQSLWELRASKS